MRIEAKLALKTTGISIAEHIISLRYWMFSRVYWSRPNRTFVAMARHLLIELSSDDEFIKRFRQKLLRFDQDSILQFFLEEAAASRKLDIIDLAQQLNLVPQELYWVAFEASKRENPEFGAIVDRIAKKSLQEMNVLRKKISDRLEAILDPAKEHTNKVLVLIDIPVEPGGGNKLGDDMMGVCEDGRIAQLVELSGIIRGVNDGFEGYLRRFRVLIHPDVAPREEPRLRYVSKSISAFLQQTV